MDPVSGEIHVLSAVLCALSLTFLEEDELPFSVCRFGKSALVSDIGVDTFLDDGIA